MRERDGIWDRLTITCALSFCVLVAGLSVGIVLGELRDELGISGVVAAAHGSAFGIGVFAVGRRITLPPSHAAPVRVLPLFGHRRIVVPWLHIVHAVLVEVPVGIWGGRLPQGSGRSACAMRSCSCRSSPRWGCSQPDQRPIDSASSRANW